MSVADPTSLAPAAERPSTNDRATPTGTRRLIRSARLLRSELALISGRTRNRAGLAVLAAVPIIIAVAIRWDGSSDGALFFSQITNNGVFVALAALTVELPMFLPLAIAMVSGDSIAGEANQGTLRYLLTVPVGRTRLLVTKYLSLIIASIWAVAMVAIPGVLVGVLLFGTGPMLTLSGGEISTAQGLWRLVLAGLYLAAGLSALAAVGLFISTLTEQPVAAAIATMIFTIVSWILTGITQISWLHPWLFVTHLMAFGDVFRQPMAFESITRGLIVFALYAAVFWAAAWARLTTRDVTS